MTDQPTTDPDDDGLCTAEYPGDINFAGQLCESPRGHDGDHEHLAVLPGGGYTCCLTWPA